ncbi:hypothetical protein OAN307_c15930 [Octadecabacter antarcticus 307]|uniref:Uncharacterized protein n=1 Tax=Octadecabacter antarcticus 307 TaxID=391626 RepID=M9RA68_9RHOB|nr:hypothetical protein [Octadecabacter antarcticus]AGI67266.1 hypothetical protein OAN307_c15930 [Octadecabacter antarcticus 307]
MRGLRLCIVLLFGLYRVLPSMNVTVVVAMFVLAGMTNGSYQQIPRAMYLDLMDVTRREYVCAAGFLGALHVAVGTSGRLGADDCVTAELVPPTRTKGI